MYYLRRSQQIFAAGKASLVLFKKINVNTNLAVVAMLLKCVNIVVCYLTTQEYCRQNCAMATFEPIH